MERYEVSIQRGSTHKPGTSKTLEETDAFEVKAQDNSLPRVSETANRSTRFTREAVVSSVI